MDNRQIDLSKYRIQESKDSLIVAENCLNDGFYKDAINRSYYSAFYAIKKDTKRIFFPSCIFLIFCISIFSH